MPEDEDTTEPAWMPKRGEYMAVLDAARRECECPPLFSVLFGQVYAPYFERNACAGCRARRILWDLIQLSESL